MTITVEDYRDVLRHFASGVTLVTTQAGDRRHGMTVSAFTSVSADPPIIAVVIDRGHSIHSLLEGPEGCFAVNLLAHDHVELSNRFAFKKGEDRFLVGAWDTAATGSPVLADALAWMDCTVEARHEAGTHTIYLGAVQASRIPRPDEAPLVYWNRDYRGLVMDS